MPRHMDKKQASLGRKIRRFRVWVDQCGIDCCRRFLLGKSLHIQRRSSWGSVETPLIGQKTSHWELYLSASFRMCRSYVQLKSSGNADSSTSLIFSAVHNCKTQFVTLWPPEMDLFILNLKIPLLGFMLVVQLFLTFGSHFVLYILALDVFSAVLWLESLPVKHQPSSFRWFPSSSNPPFS